MTSNLGNQGGRGRLPVQARDRRPALAALALLLIVAGGLGAGLIVYRTGQQTDVLVARTSIPAGHALTADDLTQVRVSGADNNTVAASQESSFVGTIAVIAIPKDTLISHNMFHLKKGLLPVGSQSLGISVPANQRPSSRFAGGDVVQAYYLQKDSNAANSGTPPTAVAIAKPLLVIGVSGGSGSASAIVSVLVNSETATQLAIPASQGNVALTQLPVGTSPEVSLNGG